jgi:hypothetical protein
MGLHASNQVFVKLERSDVHEKVDAMRFPGISGVMGSC